MAPGIPYRLVRVSGIRPRSFLVEGVFGAAHPIQQFQHVLDVTEVDLREAVNVFRRAFGFCKVLIELRTIDPFYGYAIFTKASSTSGTSSRSPIWAIACSQPAQA